jgi:serine/threonine protein kinase
MDQALYTNLIGNAEFINYLKKNDKIPKENVIINKIIEIHWKKPESDTPKIIIKQLSSGDYNIVSSTNSLQYVFRNTKSSVIKRKIFGNYTLKDNNGIILFENIDENGINELIGYFIQWVLNHTDCKNVNINYEFGFYEINVEKKTQTHIYAMLDSFEMDLENFFTNKKHNTQELRWDIIFKDIAISLNYMHSLNFYHRDIKLENIGLKRNESGNYDVVICDFGNSIYIQDTLEYIPGKTGTILYRDPYSQINNMFYKKGDEYSFGMMIYIICYLYVINIMSTYEKYINVLIYPYSIADLQKIINSEMSDKNHINLKKCFKKIVNEKIDKSKSYINYLENRKFPDKLLEEKVVVPPTQEKVVAEVKPKAAQQPTSKGGKKSNKKRRTKKNKKRRTKKNLIK